MTRPDLPIPPANDVWATQLNAGIYDVSDRADTAVRYNAQTLTAPQQTQAAANIALGIPGAISGTAEKTLFVTPRGNDANDGLTLKTAKQTLAAALTALAGGGRIQLGVGSFSTAASHGYSTGTEIVGAGPGLTTITYTGTGTLFTNATPGTRVYFLRIKDIAFVGPGKASAATCISLDDCSNAIVDGINVALFGTGIKQSSVVVGGSVYNDISRSVINSCGIGVDFQPSGSNGSRWRGVKFGACTTAVNIVDSNQNNFQACQFELNTNAVILTCSAAGLTDHNSFVSCRFENNTAAWNITSVAVRDTEILWPEIFGTLGTTTDLGLRTVLQASSPTLPPPSAQRRVLTRTGSYTIDAGQDVVMVNAASVTATLPSAASVSPGRQYTIKNLHSSALTVASTAGTIDGVATLTLSQYQVATVVSDGTNWFKVG